MVIVDTAPVEMDNNNRSRIKIVKNTKGYNWEVSIVKENNQSDEEWLKSIMNIEQKLKDKYGEAQQ